MRLYVIWTINRTLSEVYYHVVDKIRCNFNFNDINLLKKQCFYLINSIKQPSAGI